jgi:hypothetical protein
MVYWGSTAFGVGESKRRGGWPLIVSRRFILETAEADRRSYRCSPRKSRRQSEAHIQGGRAQLIHALPCLRILEAIHVCADRYVQALGR